MTAQLYPDQPQFANDSERLFVRTLQGQLPDDAVVFCNTRFSDWSQDREADVIVAWPGVGVAVVEVKGGSVSLDRGEWRQRQDGVDRVIHPVDQAVACKHLLCDYLAEHHAWTGGRPRTAHLVAVPATTLAAGFMAPGLARWMAIDKTDVPHAAARIRAALEQVRQEPDPPTADDVVSFVACLAGAAIPQQHLLAQLAEREAACELLTEDQAKVLDYLSSFPRVEIRGGAGSGKTWLAVEKARRLSAEGQRVALMCYSRGLAEFLKRRVEKLPKRQRPAYVGTFHNLGIGWGVEPGTDDDSGYWEESLPAEMIELAAALPEDQRFDAIVIDEGQDFAQSWWDAVVSALRDSDTGCLYVFSDEGQRIFARQGRPTVDLLPIPLNENLRNTKQIAGTFSSLAPGMKVRGASGVPVRFVQCTPDEAVATADDVADALLDEGWPPESLALLTTHRRHPVQVERQAEGQDAYWASYWDGEDLFYGHVLGFKGLERPAVVLAVNGFRDEARAREMLYVGLSRARDLLVVCGDLDVIRSVAGDGVVRRLTGGQGG